MKFTNLTRRTEIGANCYGLEIAGCRIVLDSGMHPKERGEESLPNWSAFTESPIEAVLVTHAHQDHIGTLPVLMRRHPEARVFMTETTGELGSVLLHNSVNVMTRQRLEVGVIYPLFTHREAEKAVDRWHRCPLHQPYTTRGEQVAGEGEVTFEFWDAGHVLGSTGVLLRGEERTIFYTGDVNFDDQTISRAAVFPTEQVDVLIMECTRGDSPQPQRWTRSGEEERLIAAIEETFHRGGCVLIPVFALGKTQEILGMIYKFRQSGELAETPVYIGGLSAKMTEIYDRRAGQIRRQLPRVQLLPEVSPFVLNGDTISESAPRAGRIYALSSGMMTEKTLSNIFARRVLENPQHAIYFVGYADPESPGGRLRAASAGDAVVLDPDQPPQELRCMVDSFQFSAHASRETLIEFAVKMAPAKVVLVHGDPPAVKWVQTQLAARLPQTEVVVPTPGISIDL